MADIVYCDFCYPPQPRHWTTKDGKLNLCNIHKENLMAGIKQW